MKYKLTDEKIKYNGRMLYRIQALKDFGDVKAGDLGGWIESERNLSQDGNCWVSDDARIYGNAWVYDNALVSHNARVYGDAWVYDDALISGNAWVSGNARVYDDVLISGKAWVSGNARVYGDTEIKNGFVG